MTDFSWRLGGPRLYLVEIQRFDRRDVLTIGEHSARRARRLAEAVFDVDDHCSIRVSLIRGKPAWHIGIIDWC